MIPVPQFPEEDTALELRRLRLERDSARFASGCFFLAVLSAVALSIVSPPAGMIALVSTAAWTLAGVLASVSAEVIAPQRPRPEERL